MIKNYLWKDNPTEANVAVYDPDVLNECLMHLKYSNQLLTRFCVNSASVDSSGNPNLLSYSGNAVNFNCGTSLVPVMTANSTTTWSLTASHAINTSANDIYKSFDVDSSTYCALAHTPTVDSPSFITVTQSAAFTFDFLYLKFSSIFNSGDMKNFSIKNAAGNVLYSYDNVGAFLDKDEFLIPISNFNSNQFIISTTSNVNNASYVNFPSTIKLLDKTQVITLTTAQGATAFLSQVAGFSLSTNGTYNVFIGTDGTVDLFATSLTSGKVLPTAPVANQVHYLTSSEIPLAEKYDGSAWSLYDKVPVGKVVVASGAITSVTTNPYAQNGYDMNLNTLLNSWGKVLSNGAVVSTLPRVVVETWNSGANFYRKYSDGWIEQGGIGGNWVNFPKPFISQVCSIVVCPIGGVRYQCVNSSTLSGFQFSYNNTDYWYACGY